MKQLLNDALIMARDNKFDVFNALDILENSREVLVDLKFGIGDGNLHYYLFNWRVHQQFQPSDIGLILM
jgi:glycylpeptide N-tetradecanoyltransferase